MGEFLMKVIIYAILAVLGYYLWKKYQTGTVSPTAARMRYSSATQSIPTGKPWSGTSTTVKNTTASLFGKGVR